MTPPSVTAATPAPARTPLSAHARWALFWTLFIGVGALAGTAMLWFFADRLGMAALLEPMRALPFASVFFTSLAWPGLFLLVVIGATHLATAALVWRRHRLAPVAVLACGAILMGWICVQFVIFPLNPLSTAYFVFGLVEAALGIGWWRRERA